MRLNFTSVQLITGWPLLESRGRRWPGDPGIEHGYDRRGRLLPSRGFGRAAAPIGQIDCGSGQCGSSVQCPIRNRLRSYLSLEHPQYQREDASQAVRFPAVHKSRIEFAGRCIVALSRKSSDERESFHKDYGTCRRKQRTDPGRVRYVQDDGGIRS